VYIMRVSDHSLAEHTDAMFSTSQKDDRDLPSSQKSDRRNAAKDLKGDTNGNTEVRKRQNRIASSAYRSFILPQPSLSSPLKIMTQDNG
jgi:hypothetical protein